MTLPLQRNLLGYKYAPAHFIHGEHYYNTLKEIQLAMPSTINESGLKDEYCDVYINWVKQSKNNSLQNLDQFKSSNFCLGTSQAFDSFYFRNREKRFRIFKGEYLYHQLVWKNNNMQWQYIENDELRTNDAVIVSLPFADTGIIHEKFTQQFLQECCEKNIPVLIDCAFFGITKNLNFNFGVECVSEVVFSLSKSFPLETYRVGMRLSKENHNDGVEIYNSSGYLNNASMYMGIGFMKAIDADYAVNRYQDRQNKLCQDLDLMQSNTVIFGIDTKNLYPQYNRGSEKTSRICFSKVLDNDQTMDDILEKV